METSKGWRGFIFNLLIYLCCGDNMFHEIQLIRIRRSQIRDKMTPVVMVGP